MEYTTETPDEDLTLLGVTAILDPLREEVPDSVESCRKAGIKVTLTLTLTLTLSQGRDQGGSCPECSNFNSLATAAATASGTSQPTRPH